jgi:hypothetical protein
MDQEINHVRITQPEQLESLPVTEQVERVVPLLRRAGLTAHPESAARHRENIPAALAILLDRWSDPESRSHKGRPIEFDEFIAIHLATEVRALDIEQQPDLYDSHRRYHTSDGYEGLPPTDALDPITRETVAEEDATVSTDSARDRLVAQMTRQGIPVASQLGALHLLAGYEDRTIRNGRQAAKALGVTDYKTHPATAPLIAVAEVANGDSCSASHREDDPSIFMRADDLI